MPTITCPTTGRVETLGYSALVSSHWTSTGRVSYFRCACGDLVSEWRDGARHINSSTQAPLPADRERLHGDRALGTYLEALSMLPEPSTWTPYVRSVVHEFVATVAKAATESGLWSGVAPAPDDAPVTFFRVLGRIAERVAGRDVPVCPALADLLDDLGDDLMAALPGPD